ncbi:MAG: hypothetical protein DRO88_06385 [Promethearchaeia archaeon]|nr:MAG: hypothetical protein DRO88_06385 [Candidatus Lokiarchaeia archaeon]
MGFIEFQIPLADLGLNDSATHQEFQMLVYSSTEGCYGAMDSSPQSDLVDPSGESFTWLTMPDKLCLDTYQSPNAAADTTEKSKIPGYSYFTLTLVILLGCAVSFLKLKNERNWLHF